MIPNFSQSTIKERISIVQSLIQNEELSHIERDLLKRILDKLDSIEDIEFHREVADRQKKYYDDSIKNKELLKDSIIIEVTIMT
jgi:hypothetical protein